jgi:hypothetical protein
MTRSAPSLGARGGRNCSLKPIEQGCLIGVDAPSSLRHGKEPGTVDLGTCAGWLNVQPNSAGEAVHRLRISESRNKTRGRSVGKTRHATFLSHGSLPLGILEKKSNHGSRCATCPFTKAASRPIYSSESIDTFHSIDAVSSASSRKNGSASLVFVIAVFVIEGVTSIGL